jgi:hypothetical protein
VASTLARIDLLHQNVRAAVRSAFNLGPLHRLVVIPAFVADFRNPAHDNDFPFGRPVVAPHPDFSEFFLEHDGLPTIAFERTVSETLAIELEWELGDGAHGRRPSHVKSRAKLKRDLDQRNLAGGRRPTGKSLYVNPKKIGFVQPASKKYFPSEFRKIMVSCAYPASR